MQYLEPLSGSAGAGIGKGLKVSRRLPRHLAKLEIYPNWGLCSLTLSPEIRDCSFGLP